MKNKKIYSETSRFQGQLLISILGLLALLVSIRLVSLIFGSGMLQWDLIGVSLFTLLLLLGIIWYYLHLQIRIKITDKGISYKLAPFPRRKEKIRWEEIDSYEIISTPLPAQWHGGNITFNHEYRVSANGRNGVLLHTHDGRSIFIGSSRLDELGNAIRQAYEA